MREEPKIGYSQKIHNAHQYIHDRFQHKVEIGIVLGTGLGKLIHDIEKEVEIDYKDIPFFPLSTVESHTGKLIFGKLGGKRVVAMQGRFHYYEGYDMKEVTFPIRVMKLLGVQHLFLSNAAGGLHPGYEIADLMILHDHIDLFPENPLRGKNLDEFGVRFPDMSEPYALDMVEKAIEIAELNSIPVHQGVYAGVQGPNLETRSEYAYLRTIGADAVGMSTIPEVIVARQMGMRVFAVSAITDLCSPGNIKPISVQEVIAAAMKSEPGMTLIFKALIKGLKSGGRN